MLRLLRAHLDRAVGNVRPCHLDHVLPALAGVQQQGKCRTMRRPDGPAVFVLTDLLLRPGVEFPGWVFLHPQRWVIPAPAVVGLCPGALLERSARK